MSYLFAPFRFMNTIINLPLRDNTDAPIMFLDYKSDDVMVYDIMLFGFLGGLMWYRDNSTVQSLELYETFKGRWLQSIFCSKKLTSIQKYQFIQRLVPGKKLAAFIEWKHSYNYSVDLVE